MPKKGRANTNINKLYCKIRGGGGGNKSMKMDIVCFTRTMHCLTVLGLRMSHRHGYLNLGTLTLSPIHLYTDIYCVLKTCGHAS